MINEYLKLLEQEKILKELLKEQQQRISKFKILKTKENPDNALAFKSINTLVLEQKNKKTHELIKNKKLDKKIEDIKRKTYAEHAECSELE